MRLKGLKVRRISKEEVQVTPLYYSRRGKEQPAPALRVAAATVKDAVADVLGKLIARGNLRE